MLNKVLKEDEYVFLTKYYKSKLCDDILKTISEELNDKGNFYDIIEAYQNYKNKHFKKIEKKSESQFIDY